jgi:integrase
MSLPPGHSDNFFFKKLMACSDNTLPTVSLARGNIYLQAATAHHTRIAYQSDIRHFEASGGLLPATTEDVLLYLQTFAPTLNPRTLSRRLTALKHWHTYQGFEDPTAHHVVRKTLKGIQNTYGKPKEKASPLIPEQLQKMVSYLMRQNAFIAWRDNALLQMGYFGAFRRSELVNIHIAHIRRVQKGIEVLVPRSKTDQTGEGQYCAIPYGNTTLCPVRALDACHFSPAMCFHKLSGSLKEFNSVIVNKNWRIIFKFEGQNAVLVDYLYYH